MLLEKTRKATKHVGVAEVGITKASAQAIRPLCGQFSPYWQALRSLAVHTVEKTLEAGVMTPLDRIPCTFLIGY